MEYYANVGLTMDSDDYFAVMMNNAWNLSGNAQTYQTYDKGWSNDQGSGFTKEALARYDQKKPSQGMFNYMGNNSSK